MNKKKIFTIAGVITTVVAMCGTAIACHFTDKKNAESKDNKQQNNQNQAENIKNKKEFEVIAMYGVPTDNRETDDKKIPNEDIIMIEKYGLPYVETPKVEEPNPPLLKYAAPRIKKEPAKRSDIMVKYALPPSMDKKNLTDDNSEFNNQNPWK